MHGAMYVFSRHSEPSALFAVSCTFRRHCSSELHFSTSLQFFSNFFKINIFEKKPSSGPVENRTRKPFGRESDTLTTVLLLQLKTSYVYRNNRGVGIKWTVDALKFEMPSSTIQNHSTQIALSLYVYIYIYPYKA